MIQVETDMEEGEDVMTCVETILSTVQGTMPYMRDMGIDGDILNDTAGGVMERYKTEAIEQAETWEDRAVVRELEVYQDEENGLNTKVVLVSGGDD